MATNFPTYPATSFEQAVDLTIFSSNQLGEVVNGDATTEVETENGLIPSVRKSLVDNFYFKSPIDWVQGSTEKVFNQLRFFSNGILSGYYYAPTATSTNPVPMSSTPSGDNNWVLYSIQQVVTPSEVYPFLLESATGDELTITPPYIFDSAIVTINGIFQVPGESYTITNSQIILKEPLGVDPDTGIANTFFAYLGKVESAVNDYIQKDVLSSVTGSSLIGEVGAATDLRTLLPIKTNQKVEVKGYIAGSTVGGGKFYYMSDSVTTDDSGTFFRVNTSGGWKRKIDDPSSLTVLDFGAVADGKTDCIPAVIAMWNWSQSNIFYQKIGVKFPSGDFYISSWDISSTYVGLFKIAGADSRYGYFSPTRLILGTSGTTTIKVQARRTEISNFEIYGQYDITPNTKGFFQNTCVAGQFVDVYGVRATYIGGKLFNLVDTLDTKFQSIYTNYTYDTVIYGTWSSTASGGWYHQTAIEITNANFQYGFNKPVLDLQRATQCFLHNVWIEHTEYPGDLSNGQWLIDGLDLENCDNPFNLTYCQYIVRGLNLISAAIVDNDLTKSRWLSGYELGNKIDDARYVKMTGSFATTQTTAVNKIKNFTGTNQWIYLGNLTSYTVGDSCVIRIMGNAQYDNIGATTNTVATSYGGGESRIFFQNKDTADKVTVHWNGSDGSPIADVKYAQQYKDTIGVYVLLKNYINSANVYFEFNGDARWQSGKCVTWNFKNTLMTAAEVSAVDYIKDAYAKFALSANTYGLYFDGETGTFGVNVKTTADNKLPININGQTRYISFTTS